MKMRCQWTLIARRVSAFWTCLLHPTPLWAKFLQVLLGLARTSGLGMKLVLATILKGRDGGWRRSSRKGSFFLMNRKPPGVIGSTCWTLEGLSLLKCRWHYETSDYEYPHAVCTFWDSLCNVPYSSHGMLSHFFLQGSHIARPSSRAGR